MFDDPWDEKLEDVNTEQGEQSDQKSPPVLHEVMLERSEGPH